MNKPQLQTRIQKKNRETILDAALDVFSAEGYRGATLDSIASVSGLSKPNLLYYFSSKEAIYTAVLERLLDTWLNPLKSMDASGDPINEILAYVQRKFELSREYPRESRLFAQEILQGAPRIIDLITGDLRTLVDEKVHVINRWVDEGAISRIDPHHLIFSIWATTQHYADFDVQIRGILRPSADSHLDDANAFLMTLYRKLLTP